MIIVAYSVQEPTNPIMTQGTVSVEAIAINFQNRPETQISATSNDVLTLFFQINIHDKFIILV